MDKLGIGEIGVAIGVAMAVYVAWRFLRSRANARRSSGGSRGIVKGNKR